MQPRTPIDQAKIADFCHRHHVRELALFGSVLRDDFRPDSDVDVLIEFEPDARVSLMDLVRMRDELMSIVGRESDLVEKPSLHNPFRRREILRTARVMDAA
ncbi:MAG: nucleotidyltransferase family protein [Chloroflexi bacterium]|nr:nucleotidyltransferase family protein [Chloroflexota bacterium]